MLRIVWFGEKVDQKNVLKILPSPPEFVCVLMADVCPSQDDNWLYPSPFTLNRQMADTGRDFCAERKFGFF